MEENENSDPYIIELPHKIFSIIRTSEELHISSPEIDKKGVLIELEIHPELEKSISTAFDSANEKTEFIEYSYLYSIYRNRIEESNSLQNNFEDILEEKNIDLEIKNNLEQINEEEIEQIKYINNQLKEIEEEIKILKERMNKLSKKNNFDKKIEKNKEQINQLLEKTEINSIKNI